MLSIANSAPVSPESYVIRYVLAAHLPSPNTNELIKSASLPSSQWQSPNTLSVWLYINGNIRYIRDTDPKLNQFSYYSTLQVQECLEIGKTYGCNVSVDFDPNGTTIMSLARWHIGISGINRRTVRDAFLAKMTTNVAPIP